MSNKLKEITYLTVKYLKHNEIILPGEYSEKFAKFAKELEVDVTNDDVILKELHHNCGKVDEIVKSTNNSLNSICESTQKAQIAIVNRDEEQLAHINKELAEMKKQIGFLQKELFSDPLTGAYNRKWFTDYFLVDEKFTSHGQIAFIDLNKFKIINDTYGHLLGDQVLKYLVKFLKKELDYDGVDIVRYAGDEFIVLFTEDVLNKINVSAKMNEVQEKLSKQKLKSAKVESLQFSFSYGLKDFKMHDDIEDILEIVDKLMYENKQKNR